MSKAQHCGRIAIVGRPNVGKSTLLNGLVGHKISITAPKPQTTRHAILGIHTVGSNQFIYVDTPGLHREQTSALNRTLNRTARASLNEVDVVLFLIEAMRWQDEDQQVLDLLRHLTIPVLLVVNKVDRIANKDEMLPFLAEMSQKHAFAAVVPLSARRHKDHQRLEDILASHLPEAPHVFSEDEITDRSMRFLAAERVREKLTRALEKELPYALTVEIESYVEEPERDVISALIWVEREGQKKIVIGEGGSMLRRVGQAAREELVELLGKRVHLQLWVKVRKGWSDDERALLSLGFGDS